MKMKKYAFTMIELVFVIVVMGIIGKFATEFLAQAYRHFISTKVQDKYQNQSQTAIDFIAKRLQYRVKASVIVRDQTNADNTANYKLLEGFQNNGYDVLEWVSYDVEGLRSQTWSGIYNKNLSNTELYSPETNTTHIDSLISTLSYGHSHITDAALFFIGSNSDKDSWGWDGVAINDFTQSMKPIKVGSSTKQFASDTTGNFSTLNLKNSIYNSYQLSWTANAIVFDSATQQLWFYTNYQPWEGDTYNDIGKNIQKVLLMEEISDFRKKQRKGIITIKVCSISSQLKDLPEDEFLTCKEKTIL